MKPLSQSGNIPLVGAGCQNASISTATTCAYMNRVVAIFLGWLLTLRTIEAIAAPAAGLNLDCADVCDATGRVLTRNTRPRMSLHASPRR